MKGALCLLVAVFSCQVLADDSVSAKWQQFQRDFGKSYKSPVEARTRYAIFEKNLKDIDEHNARYEKGEVTWKKGINQFADWKSEEFMQYVNKFKVNKNVQMPLAASRLGEESNIPESLDWRTKGAVTPVKDQGECGASWAFTATGALEGQYKLVKNLSLSFSEQNLIDCAIAKLGPYRSVGCKGGHVEDGYWYSKISGIATEEDYPYEERDDKCRPKDKTSVYRIVDYYRMAPTEKTLLSFVGTEGPMSVFIEATDNLQFYSGGVFYDKKCTRQLNHFALVVGYGNENGEDYWLVKNSWGADWGEEGFFKLARGSNNCGVAEMASYPVVTYQFQ